MKLFQLFYFSQLILTFHSDNCRQLFSQLLLMILVTRGDTSKSYLECVMIDKFVDIEGGVDVENIHIVDFPIYRRIRQESWKQVCSSNDGIKVDDACVACTSASGFWSHHPEASGSIWFVMH